jgi:hypothetical protein
MNLQTRFFPPPPLHPTGEKKVHVPDVRVHDEMILLKRKKKQ